MKTLQEIADTLKQVAEDAGQMHKITGLEQYGIIAIAIHAVRGAMLGNQWATLREAGVELAENGLHGLLHPNN